MIIAIASWYYPNPDVATSNGLEGVATAAATQNITIDSDVLKKLLLMANMSVEH